jgi:dipeptidyl-peptidase-4
VVDPRLDPTGTKVAVVVDRGLHLIEVGSEPDGRADAVQPLWQAQGPDESIGLADFIAAEELDRYRGHWWIEDGAALLVEQVDESGVQVRWIGDPTQPEQEPVSHRYPSAGTANAQVRLHRVLLDGSRSELIWDRDDYPYLASVHQSRSGVTVQVLSRDQRRGQILALDPGAAEFTVLREVSDPGWLDVIPGVPVRDDDGALVDIVADPVTDTYRIQRDAGLLTPAGLQVRGLLESSDRALTFLASAEPTTQSVYRLDLTAAEPTLATIAEGGWVSAVVDGDTMVLATTSAASPGTTFTARRGAAPVPVTSHAEQPNISLTPRLLRTGPRDLATCLLLPTDHRPGTRLSVILSPYGGPHAQRVVAAAASYATDQWIADQGFAVVIIDGRGTPGRGPSFERSIAGDLATAVLQDQVDGLQALAAEVPDLDLDRVGIRGWSFGGYLAALAVLDRPDVFHAAVAGAPVTDWRLYDTAYTERYLGDPQQDSGPYERTSLLPRAAGLSRPLLLLHGLADDNVLAAHTLQLSGALLAAGRPHAVIPLSGVTHMTPQEVVAENLLRLEVEFFRTHLHRCD